MSRQHLPPGSVDGAASAIQVTPHPKPSRKKQKPRRVVSAETMTVARLAMRECVCCGRNAGSIHHIVLRGAPHFGGDVLDNLVGLCGHGTALCHGALHGSPYTDASGHRWTQEEVATKIGLFIGRNPNMIRYVTRTLGDSPGREYLRRRYRLEIPA